MSAPTSEEIRLSTLENLKSNWDGRLPTWPEFIEASHSGKVRVSKPVALKNIYRKEISTPFRLIYGHLTMWTFFLVIPVTLTVYIIFNLSFWWIIGSIIAFLFFKHVSREGHCEAIKYTSEKDELFYYDMLKQGAFLFEPQK